MIDSRDLRLGNLVYGVSDRVETVTSILNKNWIKCSPFNDLRKSFDTEANEINPIPLTEEWLLKFKVQESSLEVDCLYWIQATDSTQLEFRVAKDGIYPVLIQQAESINEDHQMIFLNRLDYVHQLQNLYFALVGEELI